MDVFLWSRDSISQGAPIAFALALLFGVLSSAGPCFVTRLAVVTGIARSTRRSAFTVLGMFFLGLFSVYVVFAFFANVVFGYVIAYQAIVEVVLGAAFAVAGVVAIVRWRPHEEHNHDCELPTKGTASGKSLVSIALIGAASALNVSPCCAPWIVMAISVTSAQHAPMYGALLLLAFSIGHAVSLLIYARLARDAGNVARRLRWEAWTPAINCAMLFLIAIYYVVQV